MPVENIFVHKSSQTVNMESQQTVAEGVASCVDSFPQRIPKAQEGEVQTGSGAMGSLQIQLNTRLTALQVREIHTPGQAEGHPRKDQLCRKATESLGSRSWQQQCPVPLQQRWTAPTLWPGAQGKWLLLSCWQLSDWHGSPSASRFGLLRFTPWHIRASLWRANTTVKGLRHRNWVCSAWGRQELIPVFEEVAERGAEKIKPGCPRSHWWGEKHLGITAPQGIPVRYQDIPPLQ